MFVQNVRGNASDFFSNDEVIAIVYALRERSERLSAEVWSVGYANFLSVMAMKMASLTDHFDDEVGE